MAGLNKYIAGTAIALTLVTVTVLVAGYFPADGLSADRGAIVAAMDDEDDKKVVLPEDTLPEKIDLDEVPVGLVERPGSPELNPTTQEKVQLGRRLFFDSILSADGTVACASCHQPEHNFATTDALSTGINGHVGRRNAPSILNIGYGDSFFWDGRAATLEEQAIQPITSPDELGSTVEDVITKLKADSTYVEQFTAAFGDDTDPVNETNLTRAIASFERSLVLGNSRVDRFRNSDHAALSREARQGLWIFESKGGCWQCHSGRNLTDGQFHNTGVSFGTDARDTGRMEHTNDEADRFKFKTPSLRGVVRTAPYMHDGSMASLRDVVEFYSRGGSRDDEQLDRKMKPLNLSDEEIGFLVEFLKAQSH